MRVVRHDECQEGAEGTAHEQAEAGIRQSVAAGARNRAADVSGFVAKYDTSFSGGNEGAWIIIQRGVS